jgi:hypothetical protein
MRTAKTIALLGILAMGASLANAFVNGNGSAELQALVGMPWGIVSLVDLYTGFTLFAGWIFFREKSRLAALFWTIFVMTFGFFAASIYVFSNLQASGGSWQRFWMGHHA